MPPPDALALGPDDRIRLRSHLTLLRRDEHELQLGFDAADAVVVADPDHGLHRLLELMDGRCRRRDLGADAARLGVTQQRFEALLTALAAADLLQPPTPEPAALGVRLIGLGPVGTRIGERLLDSGLGRLLVSDPEGSTVLGRAFPDDERVRRTGHWSEAADGIELTVVVASCLEVDRAITTALAHAGHPHLLVRPRGAGAVVGPLVLPGETSCLGCSDLSRTRTDPAWPRLLAQLCRTRSPWDPVAADWAVATATIQTLSHLAGRTVETASATLELGPRVWSWQRRVWAADPACGCCWFARAEW